MVVSELQNKFTKKPKIWKSLNPCFDGWWYRRERAHYWWTSYDGVLILVLMDGGIGVLLINLFLTEAVLS